MYCIEKYFVLCSLISLFCTQFSVLCTLYSVYCIRVSGICSLYFSEKYVILWILYSVLYTLYSVHFIVLGTLYFVLRALFVVPCSLSCSTYAPCTMYYVHCIPFYNLGSLYSCNRRNVFCTLNYVFYSLYSVAVIRILYSVFYSLFYSLLSVTCILYSLLYYLFTVICYLC